MMFKETITGVLRAFGELVFTPRCAACDARLLSGLEDPLGQVFCPPCAISIDGPGAARCPRCAAIFETGEDDHLCAGCLKDPPPFTAAWSPFAYGGSLARGITRLKYGPSPWLARPLGGLLAGELLQRNATTETVDLVVPVPLHPRRLRRRGFNQAALLAHPVARRLSVPLNTSALVRVAETPFQAGSDRATRLARMKNCFAVRPSSAVEGRTILLLDDVVTTTATVRDASRSLLAAGAAKIVVASLARSI